jgi:crotonobetainyl-CoA:carnitine CoA-transferase CaiB-like acyl-CoA transferase
MSQLPYAGISVVERSGLLAARLLGLLLADRGVQVLVARSEYASQARPAPGVD